MARIRTTKETVIIGGKAIGYRLHRVPRRKHIHLLVDERGSLVVRAPYRCSTQHAGAAIQANHAWALRALERARRSLAQRPTLDDGCPLPFLDGSLVLRLHITGRPGVWRDGSELCVAGTELGGDALRAHLSSWYRREAREHLIARVQNLALRVGLAPQRVLIRGQRTRWGSCSARGTVSLNWRLMQLPQSLGDYVVVHELCHLRHLNHSPVFWNLVEGIVPDWRERRARLRELHGRLPL